MTTKTIDEIIDIAEGLDWSVSNLGKKGFSVKEGTVELEFGKYSPAGENFHFTVDGHNADEIVKAISEYSAGFDTEEHIEGWIGARQHGVSGVTNAKELVADAEEIEIMLRELSEAVTYGAIQKDEFDGAGTTRGLSIAILKMFETLLDKYDIKILDNDCTVSDDEDCINGVEFDNLEGVDLFNNERSKND